LKSDEISERYYNALHGHCRRKAVVSGVLVAVGHRGSPVTWSDCARVRINCGLTRLHPDRETRWFWQWTIAAAICCYCCSGVPQHQPSHDLNPNEKVIASF